MRACVMAGVLASRHGCGALICVPGCASATPPPVWTSGLQPCVPSVPFISTRIRSVLRPRLQCPKPPCYQVLTPDIYDIEGYPSPEPPSDVEVEAKADVLKGKAKVQAPKRKSTRQTVSCADRSNLTSGDESN